MHHWPGVNATGPAAARTAFVELVGASNTTTIWPGPPKGWPDWTIGKTDLTPFVATIDIPGNGTTVVSLVPPFDIPAHVLNATALGRTGFDYGGCLTHGTGHWSESWFTDHPSWYGSYEATPDGLVFVAVSQPYCSPPGYLATIDAVSGAVLEFHESTVDYGSICRI